MKSNKNKKSWAIEPKQYTYREAKYDGTQCDLANLNCIQNHIAEHIAPVDWVWGEIASSLVHIDVLVIEPSSDRPFFTLVTSGMSQKPMKTPLPEVSQCKYSELVLCLPPNWSFGEAEIREDRNFWPISMMKMIAHFPHLHDTWVWSTQTIHNQQPYDESVPFSGAMLIQASPFGEDFHLMKTERVEPTVFHSLIPLHQSELNYYIQHGAQPLLDKLVQQKLSLIIDTNRPSVI